MDAQKASEWSRTHTVFGDPNMEVLRLGALLRIADSLEKIERHIFAQTPEGERWAKQREADDLFWRAVGRVALVIAHRGISGSRCSSMARALVTVCGPDADPESPECWRRVMEQAPKVVRRWGNARNERLREWVESQWPHHTEAAQ